MAAKQTKVKMLVSIAGHAEPRYDHADFSLAPGDVVELHPDLADAWVKGGHAEAAKKNADVTVTLSPAPVVEEEEPAPVSQEAGDSGAEDPNAPKA